MLNLAIQQIDRLARSTFLQRFDLAAVGRGLTTRQRHLTYMAVWAVLFVVILLQTATDVALARGDIFMYHGRVAEALESYREFVDARPTNGAGHYKLGSALLRAGRPAEALPALERAVQLQPEDAVAHNDLGLALLQTGKAAEAVGAIGRAVSLFPDYPEAHYNLAQAHSAAGQPRPAVQALREALRLRADWPAAMGALAWLQVTQADPEVYDPAEALGLATRAADLSGRSDVAILDALAASYAAAGRFEDAARTAEAAEALALQSAPHLAANIRARLARYRSGQPLIVGSQESKSGGGGSCVAAHSRAAPEQELGPTVSREGQAHGYRTPLPVQSETRANVTRDLVGARRRCRGERRLRDADRLLESTVGRIRRRQHIERRCVAPSGRRHGALCQLHRLAGTAAAASWVARTQASLAAALAESADRSRARRSSATASSTRPTRANTPPRFCSVSAFSG